MVEQPKHAIEMLLSTQLSGVIFGNLLVELAANANVVTTEDRLVFSPGTSFELTANLHGAKGVMRVRSQGKTIRLQPTMCQTLQAVAAGCSVGEAIRHAGGSQEAACLDTLGRFVRLRMLNRCHGDIGTIAP